MSETTHMDAADWDAALSSDRWSIDPSALGTLTVDGLLHRIIWSVPEEAFAHGYTIAGEPGTLTAQLVEGVATAREQGGAWLWIIVRGDADHGLPLGPGPHDVAQVHVVTKKEAKPTGDWVEDLESDEWGRPEWLWVTPQRGAMRGTQRRVHMSRLAYIPGARATATTVIPDSDDVYDYPVTALYRDAIRDMNSAWESTRWLTKNRAMPWIKLALRNASTTEAAGEMVMRLAVIAKSMARGLLALNPNDEVGWSAPPIAGTSEVIQAAALRVSAPEGVPISRFFGTPPGGLSTDDEAGRRSWESLIERTRASVEPALTKVWRAVHGEGSPEIEWPPVSTPTRTEAATEALTLAQRDGALITTGVITADESRERVRQSGEVPLLPEPVFGEPDAPLLTDG